MQDLKTILLVEDHPNDVDLTLEALAAYRLANDIVVVNDGEATLDYWRGRFAGREPAPPAVVLLDLKMPKVDGLAALCTVKADPAFKPIPIVIDPAFKPIHIVMLTFSSQERLPQTGNLRYTAPGAPLSPSGRQFARTCESSGVSEAEWEGVINRIPGPPPAKKRGRRIHRARTWAGGLCASLLALAAVNCHAGQTAPAPTTNAARVPENSGVAQLKKLSLEELMDIEVTSVSKHPERLSETASAIQVITQEDIRRSGATRLPEALRLASNLEVAQIDSRRWAISARGFNSPFSNKLLVLIDGRTVYTPLFAGVRWEVQDTLLEDIDRIEVISGPGATLWGANAVNGVINIITKDAKDTQRALLLGGGGTELNGFGGMRYGGALTPNLRYRVYGKYFDRDGTVRPDGRDGSDDWHMGQGGFRMDWDASESNVFTVQGDGYDGRISQADADEIEVSGANVIGRWSHTFYQGSDLALQLYYDRTHRNDPRAISEDLDTYDVDFQHRFPLGEWHDIVWGLGYRLIEDDIGNNTLRVNVRPSQVSRQWFSGFVQDEIALVKDRLHLTLGTKIEHNDYTGFEFQPSGRLAWRLSEQQTLWSAISRAVRTPSRIDREFFQSTPFRIDGGPDFDSEELLAYELGYRVQPFSRLALSLAAYYNDYDDVRSRESRPAGVFEVANGLEGESYGAELTADYRVTDGWRLRAGYTELRIDLRPKPGSTDVTRGRNESNDSKHHFSLRSSLDLPGHWEWDAAFRYVSRIDNQRVPAYGELDVRLGWRPSPELEFSIVGQNLLHDDHVEFGALTTLGEITRREIERGVFAKVLWRF